MLPVFAAALLAFVPLVSTRGLYLPKLRRQDGPVDPEAPSDCTFFDTARNIGQKCDYFESSWGISHEDFVSWNPSVKQDCSGIVVGNSYCVEVNYGLPRPTTTRSPPSSPSPTGSPKPSPTQDGLISTCVNFYKVIRGDTCDKIVSKYQTFTTRNFVDWNPAVGDDCTGLAADVYYCVGIPGTPTAPVPSPTVTPTGVAKPSPTQEGLIDSCTTFYKAVKGDICDKIVQRFKTFTGADFIQWNPAVGNDCSGLQADVYYCVGIPGTPTSPPPVTSTIAPTPTNGIATPQPIQSGMVGNCDAFYQVKTGDGCQSIADRSGISLAEFTTWNTQVGGPSCPRLVAGNFVCVSIVGHSPTTPPPQPTVCNAPQAPQPTQPGAICSCRRWHQVGDNQFCDDIRGFYGITAAQFNAWNPQVGSDCKTLWKGHYVCVGI